MFSNIAKNIVPDQREASTEGDFHLSKALGPIISAVWLGLENFSFGPATKSAVLKASEMFLSLCAIKEKNAEKLPEPVFSFLEAHGMVEIVTPGDHEIKASDLRSLDGELRALQVLKQRRAAIIEEIGKLTNFLTESESTIASIKPGYLTSRKLNRHQRLVSNNAKAITDLQAESLGILRILRKLEPSLLADIKDQTSEVESYARSPIGYIRLSALGREVLQGLEQIIGRITALHKEVQTTETEVSQVTTRINVLSGKDSSRLEKFVSRFRNKADIDKALHAEENRLRSLAPKLVEIKGQLAKLEELQILKPKPKDPTPALKPSPAVVPNSAKPPSPAMPTTAASSSKSPAPTPVTAQVVKAPSPAPTVAAPQKSQAAATPAPAPSQSTKSLPLIDQLSGFLGKSAFADALDFFEKSVLPCTSETDRNVYIVSILESLAQDKASEHFSRLLTIGKSSLTELDFSVLVKRISNSWAGFENGLPEAIHIAFEHRDVLRKNALLSPLSCDLLKRALALKDLALIKGILDDFSDDIKAVIKISDLVVQLFRIYMDEEDFTMAKDVLARYRDNFPTDVFSSNLKELVTACIENQLHETFRSLILELRDYLIYSPELEDLVENYVELLISEGEQDQAENFLAKMDCYVDSNFIVEMEVKISGPGSAR